MDLTDHPRVGAGRREKPSASMKRQWEKSVANNRLFKN
jgi:hypothetical protein